MFKKISKRYDQWLALDLRVLLKNSSWLFPFGVLQFVLLAIQSIVTARFLGPDYLGLLAMVVVYVTIANQIIDCRIQETAIKYISYFKARNDDLRAFSVIKFCYFIDFLTGLIAFVIVSLTAGFIARTLIHRPEASGLISLYAMFLLFATVNGTSYGVLINERKFAWISIYSVFLELVSLSLVVAFLILGYGVFGVIAAYLIASGLGAVILLIKVFKILKGGILKNKFSARLSALKGYFGSILKFTLANNIHESLNLFTKNVDIAILGFFRPAAEVGYYKLAKNLVSGVDLFSGPLYTVLYPQISDIWHSGRLGQLRVFLKRFIVFTIILAVFAGVGFFIVTPWFIRYLVGSRFLISLDPARVMVFGSLAALIFVWVRPVYLSIGKPWILTLINLMNAVILVVFSFIMVPVWGYMASAWLFFYVFAGGNIIAAYLFYRFFNKEGKGE